MSGTPKTATLLSQLQLSKSITLRNRVVMAPMTRDRGVGSDLNVEYYRQRAADLGLIITEGLLISKQGTEWRNAAELYTPTHVTGWKRVTDAVHKEGGVIFAQIWHVGRLTHPLNQGGLPVVGASPIRAPGGKIPTDDGDKEYQLPQEIKTEDVSKYVELYRQGAIRAKEANFDGVELHGAFGYLINQFLLDGSNQRKDKYGGSIENRCRFALEVVDAACSAIGSDRVGIKLSPSSPYNGMSDSNPEAVYTHLFKELNKRKLAYVHIMDAQLSQKTGKPYPGAPFLPAKIFRPLLRQTPLIVNVGYTYQKGTQALIDGIADAVSFGTLSLSNPDLSGRFLLESQGKLVKYNQPDFKTLYGGGAKGYTDYPSLTAEQKADKKIRVDIGQSFTEALIVPDLIQHAPVNELDVKFADQKLVIGQTLTPTQVSSVPVLNWLSDKGAFYTIIFADPDAPNGKDPKFRSWLHWLVVNVPENNISKGDTLAEFVSSAPGKDSGLHRYTLLVYKQTKRVDKGQWGNVITSNSGFAPRRSFNVSKFIATYELQERAVAGSWYRATYDDLVPTLHANLTRSKL